jgi:hypothetical protein
MEMWGKVGVVCTIIAERGLRVFLDSMFNEREVGTAPLKALA